MSRYIKSAANGRYYAGSGSNAPTLGLPCTISFFACLGSLDGGGCAIYFGPDIGAYLLVDIFNNYLYANQYPGAAAVSQTTIQNNRLHHCCCRFTSNTRRDAAVDGVFGSANTDNGIDLTGQATANLVVGCQTYGSPTNHFSGHISDLCLWNESLSNGEVLSIAQGKSTITIRPHAITAYWPMRSDLHNWAPYGQRKYRLLSTHGVDIVSDRDPISGFDAKRKIILSGGSGGGGGAGIVRCGLSGLSGLSGMA